MKIISLTDVYGPIYQTNAESDAPSAHQPVIVRENPEYEAVSSFLKGNVPEKGTPIVDLVNQMVF